MTRKKWLLSLLFSFTAAQIHSPVGEPNGNVISRPRNEVVPACKPFTITWQPTTPNTVSVLLLKGPASNVVKFGPALAEGIANSGSLVWTPDRDLEATTGPQGYGIQIIDDVTGQYQYSTQFGISKGSECGGAETPTTLNQATTSAASNAPSPQSSSLDPFNEPAPSRTRDTRSTASAQDSISTAGTQDSISTASTRDTISTASTATAERSSTPPSSSTQSNSSSPAKSRMSPGTIAAISVGTVFGITLLAVILFVLHRRKKKGNITPEEPKGPSDGMDAPEVVYTQYKGEQAQYARELDGRIIHEMPSTLAELHDKTTWEKG